MAEIVFNEDHNRAHTSETGSTDEKIDSFHEKDPEAYAQKVDSEDGVREDGSIDEAIGDITNDIVLVYLPSILLSRHTSHGITLGKILGT
jgi:hypothetical protein